MATISESEFKRICEQIYVDRKQIYQFNPTAAHDEVLLWMLLSCLISYLSLPDSEIPCFPGAPDAETYRQAILHVLRGRTEPKFDTDFYLREIIEKTKGA